jgi:uncharacterized radical SAM protein YgiQ
MFLPVTKEEIKKLGWPRPDVILVSGDTYIDSSFSGAAMIGKFLMSKGYKVAVIAQPDLNTDADIARLGEPALFWGVTSGCVDSMVANYTASGKPRRTDDFTPGGENNRRPDRAVIAYTNLIRKYFKKTVPIVIGGIEASLRRVVHYDFWTDSLRRSILFDSKADYLVYGMGEKAIYQLAEALSVSGKNKPDNIASIRGICYISGEIPEDYIKIPSYDECRADKEKFTEMFNIFYRNNDPLTAKGLCQKHTEKYLVQNPPAFSMSQEEIDSVYGLKFENDLHPFYNKYGKVKALDTIQFSITTHRGCYGECSFCAIAVHQGRTVVSRSTHSIISEAERLAAHKHFKGYISDVGGPTANMYAIECPKKISRGACGEKSCLFPDTCKGLRPDHRKQTELLRRLRKIAKVKKVFVASGIRYDMIIRDENHGNEYLRELVEHHISGQMKIAPEHTEPSVLKYMRKPDNSFLAEFRRRYIDINKKLNKNQFLTYYLIAAHPGCGELEMTKLKEYARTELKTSPEQVQIFTPTPSTYSTLMYYTERDPFTGEKIFVEKRQTRKEAQKEIVSGRPKQIRK